MLTKRPIVQLKCISQPKPGVKTNLYPHQEKFLLKALSWERKGHGGLLGAEMGTGKTLMMLCLFATNLNKVTNTPKRTLVIAPLSLLQNWRNEYNRHLSLPADKVCIYHGKQRHQIPLGDRYLVITSYETIRQDISRWNSMSPLIQHFRPERLVLDEAHEIKNQDSQRFQALLELPGRLRWAMTGTPIQNYRDDLESITGFIGLAPYSSPEWWKEHQNQEDLDQWKQESYIYFSKESINLGLPTRHFNHHMLDFDEGERECYQAMKSEVKEIFEEYLDGGSNLQFGMILTKILRLKQICNHPITPLATVAKEQKDAMKFFDSTKTTQLIRVLNNIPKTEKLVVFSQFRETLKIIQQSLDTNGYVGSHLIYHGGLTPSAKEEVLRKFEKNDEHRVLLMSIKAGGVGLNLVRANHIILFDPWWNRAIEEQALARVHRIGQTREVHVHRLSIKNSIEQWVIGLQEHKLEIASQILDSDFGDGVGYDKAFSQDDLKKLFRESCY